MELELREVREENRTTQRIAGGSRRREPYAMTPAQVIGRNPSTWFSDLIINKGSKDGIQVDMPEVTHQGLVGKITAVYPSYSKLQLIISPNSSIGAIVQRTRDNLCVLIGLVNSHRLYQGYLAAPTYRHPGERHHNLFTPDRHLSQVLTIDRVVEVY